MFETQLEFAAARTDEQVVQQTEALAAALAALDGYVLQGASFRNHDNPRSQGYWKRACLAQEMLTCTDPNDAVSALDEDYEDRESANTLAGIDAGCYLPPLPRQLLNYDDSAIQDYARAAVVNAVESYVERIGVLEVDLKKAHVALQAERSNALEEAAQACSIPSDTSTTKQFELGVEFCSLAVRELKGLPPSYKGK